MKRLLAILSAVLLILTIPACSATKDETAGIDGMAEGYDDGDAFVVDGAQERPSAGTLTCGEWKDLDDLEFWKDLLRHNDIYTLMKERALYPDKISVVRVTDADQSPCFNATVELLSENGDVL